MKTTSPTLRILQLTQPTKSGLYPIVVRAQWNGCAEKRTGVAVPKNAWNPKSSTIKASYPNAASLNSIIDEVYKTALSRKLFLQKSGEPFAVHDIFGEGAITNKLDVEWLTEQLIKERNLSPTSAKTIRGSVSVVTRHIDKKPVLLTQLNIDTLQAIARTLSNEGRKNGTVVTYMYSICNIWNYAISKKYVPASSNPFVFFNPRKVYREEVRKKAITPEVYELIKNELDNLLSHNPDTNNFLKVNTKEFALSMYVLGYTFGGLALVDMACLKKDQISLEEIEGTECYIFNNVRRKKTNHPVPITVRRDGDIAFILDIYMATPGEYLFPILNEIKPINDITIAHEVERAGRFIKNWLRKVTGKDDITYYSCRHSFATHYITKPGASPVYLASMMGRSVNGIFRYVQDIYSNEDLLRERERMGL